VLLEYCLSAFPVTKAVGQGVRDSSLGVFPEFPVFLF
jgi:hypothetical protein